MEKEPVRLDTPITQLGLSTRAVNGLLNSRVLTVGDLLQMQPYEVVQMRSVGAKTTAEILGVIQRLADGDMELPDHDVTVDTPVSSLTISNRLKNSLTKAGFLTVGQMLDMQRSDIGRLSGAGGTTLAELEEKLPRIRYSVKRSLFTGTREELRSIEEFCERLADFLDVPRLDVCNTILAAKEEAPDQKVSDDEEVNRFFVTRYVQTHTDVTVSKARIKSLLEGQDPDIQEFITSSMEASVRKGRLKELPDSWEIVKPTAMEILDALPDDRNKEMVKLKFSGYTLEAIGTAYSLTRERIRQILRKYISRHLKGAREHDYCTLYRKYALTKELYAAFTGGDGHSWYATACFSETMGKASYEEIPGDLSILESIRIRAERYINSLYVVVAGKRIKPSRKSILYALLEQHEDGEEWDELMVEYQACIEQLGLPQDEYALNDRYYQSVFTREPDVLTTSGRHVRYFPLSDDEFKELADKLELSRYLGQEISTKLVMRDHPEVMQAYAIHNEYELHNILKNHKDLLPGYVDFPRQPTLLLGRASRESQMVNLMFEMAPVSKEELAKAYEERYGVQQATVLANYLSPVEPYLKGGRYYADLDSLDPGQEAMLKPLLTDDILSVDQVEQAFKAQFPEGKAPYISQFAFKKLGYKVTRNLLYRSKYASAAAAIKAQIKDGVLDVSDRSWLAASMDFKTTLLPLVQNLELIEYEPGTYVSMKKLEEQGYSKEEFQDFLTEVLRFVPSGSFTIRSLKQDGFHHPLLDKDLDEICYLSILKTSPHLAWNTMGGVIVYQVSDDRQRSRATALIRQLVEEAGGSLRYGALKKSLEERFGIVLSDEKLRWNFTKEGLYYSRSLGEVYRDYHGFQAQDISD